MGVQKDNLRKVNSDLDRIPVELQRASALIGLAEYELNPSGNDVEFARIEKELKMSAEKIEAAKGALKACVLGIQVAKEGLKRLPFRLTTPRQQKLFETLNERLKEKGKELPELKQKLELLEAARKVEIASYYSQDPFKRELLQGILQLQQAMADCQSKKERVEFLSKQYKMASDTFEEAAKSQAHLETVIPIMKKMPALIRIAEGEEVHSIQKDPELQRLLAENKDAQLVSTVGKLEALTEAIVSKKAEIETLEVELRKAVKDLPFYGSKKRTEEASDKVKRQERLLSLAKEELSALNDSRKKTLEASYPDGTREKALLRGLVRSSQTAEEAFDHPLLLKELSKEEYESTKEKAAQIPLGERLKTVKKNKEEAKLAVAESEAVLAEQSGPLREQLQGLTNSCLHFMDHMKSSLSKKASSAPEFSLAVSAREKAAPNAGTLTAGMSLRRSSLSQASPASKSSSFGGFFSNSSQGKSDRYLVIENNPRKRASSSSTVKPLLGEPNLSVVPEAGKKMKRR